MKLEQEFNKALTKRMHIAECEIIADMHAIKFARWLAERPKIFNNGSSMEQALSLFKIQENI